MIWFTCKQCGKTHSRPENSAGTMIFCTCGSGLTVPWESTVAEPPPAVTLPVAPAPKVPDLAPIQFDPVKISSPDSGRASTYPTAAPPVDDERPYTRRGRTEKRDPDFCFNHQRRPKVEACAECGESFCAGCLVKFQKELVCGPCKNFRARRQELLPTASNIASASLIISLLGGPLMMCLLMWSPSNEGLRVISWLALLPQVLALGLGIWALYEAEKERKAGGQWVAITGVAASGLTCVMLVLLNLAAYRLAVPV